MLVLDVVELHVVFDLTPVESWSGTFLPPPTSGVLLPGSFVTHDYFDIGISVHEILKHKPVKRFILFFSILIRVIVRSVYHFDTNGILVL